MIRYDEDGKWPSLSIQVPQIMSVKRLLYAISPHASMFIIRFWTGEFLWHPLRVNNRSNQRSSQSYPQSFLPCFIRGKSGGTLSRRNYRLHHDIQGSEAKKIRKFIFDFELGMYLRTLKKRF